MKLDFRRIFMISPPKTGSTLLARLLDQHPKVAVIRESYSLVKDHPNYLLNPESRTWRAHGFTRKQIERWRLLADEPEKLIRAYCDAYAEIRGADIVIESWPFWGRHSEGALTALKNLHASFPSWPWICGLRDSRAVAWSTFTSNSLSAATKDMLEMHAGIDVAVHSIGHPWLPVRYEDLVVDPERCVRQIWRGLGLDPDEGWIEYDPNRDPHPQRWRQIPKSIESIDPAVADRWKTEMPGYQANAVTESMRPYLERYGYDTASRMSTGDVLNAFLSGGPVPELSERRIEVSADGIDLLRKELSLAYSIPEQTRMDVQDVLNQIKLEVQERERAPMTMEWERWHEHGQIMAMMHFADTLGHLQNRIVSRMST
jgi:hypothetical protein